nr:DedA family protein [Cohnella lubricantis]
MFGLPVPDEVLLTAAGYLISRGSMHLGWTMLAAVGGSVVGMSASYWLGRSLGLALLRRFGKRFGLTDKRLERHEKLVERWGQAVVLIGYFVPGLRHMTALLCGVGKRSYASFLFHTALGALLWTSVYELAGSLLGEHWRDVATVVNRDSVMLLTGAAVLSATALIWKRMFGARS